MLMSQNEAARIVRAARQAAAPRQYKRPAVKRRRNLEPGELLQRPEPGELPASSVTSIRPQIPQWLRNRKVTYYGSAKNGNRIFFHNNRSAGIRYFVRVSKNQNITNGQIIAPLSFRNINAILHPRIASYNNVMTQPRKNNSLPRPTIVKLPNQGSKTNNTSQANKNSAYIKRMVTRIIHKLTEPEKRNKENREYISRVVSGIINKIKKQNSNKNYDPFKRTRTNALPTFMLPKVNKKNQVIRALMAKGMTKKQAEVKEMFMNNNDVNNLLRPRSAKRSSPKTYNTGNKTYKSPPKLPQIIVAKTEAAVKALPFTKRQVNRPRNQRAIAPESVNLKSFSIQPVSSVEPIPKPPKKKNNARSRILKAAGIKKTVRR